MRQLSATDWCVFACYLGIVLALGIFFARRQRDNEEYFVGGRRMNWFAVGVSLFATAFSSISFVALPREGAYENYHLLITYLCIPLIITPVLWWVFVPVYRRLGVTSVYEYLEIRFSPSMRRLGTLLFALYAIGWMGSMVFATGLIIKAVLKLSETQFIWTLVAVGLFATLYTVLGGIKAVIWTDVLQAVTLGGGMIAVFFLTLERIDGGWDTVLRLGVENDKFQMFDMDLDMTRGRTFFSALAIGLFAYLPGYTTSQITVQRYVCTRDLGDARRALVINAAVAAIVAVLFFAVGTTLYAFYHQEGGSGFPKIVKPDDQELEARDETPETEDQTIESKDQLMPHFVLNNLPYVGLSGLLLAGLFAAVMSTIDSGINSLSAVLVYDWLGGRHLSVTFSRFLCFLFGICVIGAALLTLLLRDHPVIDIIMMIAGSFLGLLMGVYLLGMLVPRANTGGALVGLAAGAAGLAFVSTCTEVHGWWYGIFTCLPAFLVGVAASYLFSPPCTEQLKGLAFGTSRKETP